MVDWSKCADVERKADVVSGAWVLVGTRLPVDAILENAEDFTAEEIVDEIYPGIPVDVVRRVIAFAREGAHAPAVG
jgi:uncharacterized protein (DUF433 family)